LASGSYDDTIKLYVDDPSDDWYCFTTLKGHDSTVWSLSWSPCGRYLASASDDKTVRIWAYVDSATGVAQVKPPSVLASSQGEGRWVHVAILDAGERSVYSVSWGKGKSGKGLGWLASAGGDGTVRVWDVLVSWGPPSVRNGANVMVGTRRVEHRVEAQAHHIICGGPWRVRRKLHLLESETGQRRYSGECRRRWVGKGMESCSEARDRVNVKYFVNPICLGGGLLNVDSGERLK